MPPQTNNLFTHHEEDDTITNIRDVVYLTGASGFIGQMIVKLCEKNDSISKVYCPIRGKNGASGNERFENLLGSLSKKATFIEPSASLPNDVTVVILNAFSVKFYNPVDEILKNNVKPMLHLLDQCSAAGDRIHGVCVVSTAYVQPPLPFRRNAKNQIEFALKEQTTAYGLYQELVSGAVNWNDVLDKYGCLLSNHHKINCYAFSKHVMEHVIHELYPSLPICVHRPSIVAPSRDCEHGIGTRTGFPLFMEIARHPILRFPRNEGKLNVVFVEDVALDIIVGATKLAKPASVNDQGTLFHPIFSGTSTSELTPIEMLLGGAPHVSRFDIKNDHLRALLRKTEVLTVKAVMGAKKASLVEKVYENFDPIMSNNWDFEACHAPTAARVLEMARESYQKGSGYAVESKSPGPVGVSYAAAALFLLLSGALCVSMGGAELFFPVLKFILLFMFLHWMVPSGMQSLFYSGTVLRKLVTATLYPKEHDKSYQ